MWARGTRAAPSPDCAPSGRRLPPSFLSSHHPFRTVHSIGRRHFLSADSPTSYAEPRGTALNAMTRFLYNLTHEESQTAV